MFISINYLKFGKIARAHPPLKGGVGEVYLTPFVKGVYKNKKGFRLMSAKPVESPLNDEGLVFGKAAVFRSHKGHGHFPFFEELRYFVFMVAIIRHHAADAAGVSEQFGAFAAV